MLRLILAIASLGWVVAPAHAQPPPAARPDTFQLNPEGALVALRARAELGAVGVVSHTLRYGSTSRVDYRDDADQDTLQLFARLSAELGIRDRHSLLFLYQPLRFASETVVGRELQVAQVTFPSETLVRFGYDFDFYRAEYQYDFATDSRTQLALGGGFQIRNARVSFVSSDGERAFTTTGPGVVPLLRVRAGYVFDNALFVEGELSGWVSPIPGQQRRAGKLALGSIVDAALRAGVRVTRSVEAFLTLRYLGGGYRGDSSGTTPLLGDDTWSSNWLHTMTLSLGLGLY